MAFEQALSMPVADVLATYLQAQGVGTLGTSIFIDYMPDAHDVLCSVYELPGIGPSYVMAKGEPLTQTRVQVFTRGIPRDYQGTRLKARQVAGWLRQVHDSTHSGMRFVEVSATDIPHLHERDSKERVVFTQFWEIVHEADLSLVGTPVLYDDGTPVEYDT